MDVVATNFAFPRVETNPVPLLAFTHVETNSVPLFAFPPSGGCLISGVVIRNFAFPLGGRWLRSNRMRGSLNSALAYNNATCY